MTFVFYVLCYFTVTYMYIVVDDDDDDDW